MQVIRLEGEKRRFGGTDVDRQITVGHPENGQLTLFKWIYLDGIPMEFTTVTVASGVPPRDNKRLNTH